MNTEEVYYEFILPNYESLSTKSSTTSSSRQVGQVKALCDACPERVITYDALSGKNVSNYSGWASTKKNSIKEYVDQYIAMPKYFDLRNYQDTNPTQAGGMSLMVSHSPEIGPITIWTKFKAKDGKTVYCSLMVSSGDFFYGWNLPDEVLIKSGLRDRIVRDRFHSNWYYRGSLTDGTPSGAKQVVGQEKRVFVQHYFSDGYTYGKQIKNYFIYYTKADRTTYVSPFTTEIDYYINGTTKPYESNPAAEVLASRTDSHKTSYLETAPTDNQYFFIRDTKEKVIRYRYAENDVDKVLKDPADETQGFCYYVKGSSQSIELNLHRTPETYGYLNEDLKKDFIDLEVTRRILHCNDLVNIEYISTIPKVVSGSGKQTVLSYDPPDEYKDNSPGHQMPLQIPYHLLRDCLNDRAPFGDCETLLVMWVADSDPDSVADGNVQGLHNLNWQQYAIPISVRCCFKDAANNSEKYSHERFLVTYPFSKEATVNYKSNPIVSGLSLNHYAYRYHIRHCENYNNSLFREVLYLSDLARYSQDYILVYQPDTNGYNIQKLLFTKNESSFKKLYVRITTKDVTETLKWSTNTQQQQAYYLAVEQTNNFKITTTNSSIPLCLESISKPGTAFTPSSVIKRDNYLERWNFPAENYFYVSGAMITLFSNTAAEEVSGSVKLVNLGSSFDDVNDLYLTPFGFCKKPPLDVSSYLHGVTFIYIPLGQLDDHIQIGSTLYGSTKNNKVVVGFKNAFDYKYSDYLHFTKSSNNNFVSTNATCTAYVVSI